MCSCMQFSKTLGKENSDPSKKKNLLDHLLIKCIGQDIYEVMAFSILKGMIMVDKSLTWMVVCLVQLFDCNTPLLTYSMLLGSSRYICDLYR